MTSSQLDFESLLDELETRTSRAHASLLAPRSTALRAWLAAQLSEGPGGVNSLLSTPVFEPKFGFRQISESMAQLEARGLITTTLVDGMDRPPKPFGEQAFRRHYVPYTHQLEAWEALKDEKPRSVVVSAGTGSGKTECFLVPILDDLARQADLTGRPLNGVQALFLYPLNALINSQRERLSAWTRNMSGRVRYCLYNGETSSTVNRQAQREQPERVLSRQGLRQDAPPMLITNATMLEYMLVRPDDQPILDQSRGKLKYIVIDEAHTYVGSMAAELSLLLRRVMNAFHVEPQSVRFIATSATLSSSSSLGDLRKFLADVAGQPENQVTVITDERHVPSLQPASASVCFRTIADFPKEERYEALLNCNTARAVRSLLTDRGALTLRDLRAHLSAAGHELTEKELLRLLDVAKDARPGSDSEPFLPLRGHIFARGVDGIWACINPSCPGRLSANLDSSDWPFGTVYLTARSHCSHPECNAQTHEVVLCRGCGEAHLLGELVDGNEGVDRLTPVSLENFVPTDPEEAEDEDEAQETDEGAEMDEGANSLGRDLRLLARDVGTGSVRYDPNIGSLGSGTARATLIAPDDTERLECVGCGKRDASSGPFFRSCRTGRNFMLGVAVPALLSQMPPADRTGLPFDGRRTITFTDSRQGTARFAARAQRESERNFVRSFVYHTVLAKQETDVAGVASARKELAKLRLANEKLSGAVDLSASISAVEANLSGLLSSRPVPILEVAQELSNSLSFGRLHRYWKDYLPFQQAGITEAKLARWLVYREFARRPMRRASLETLGLIKAQFPKLSLEPIPPLWTNWSERAGQAACETWSDFLKLLVDFYLRSNSVLTVDADFFKWVGTTIRPKFVHPTKEAIRNRRIAWVRLAPRTRPRLVWMVCRAFNLDLTSADTRERINDVLDRAWESIRPSLQSSDDGWAIALGKMTLTPLREAWLCPVSGMLLDTTLAGQTPYQPPLDRAFDTRARLIRMPQIQDPFWNSGGASAAHDFIEKDEVLATARREGAISEFTERVYAKAPYFQVAEHSAQLTSTALQKTERQFREGRLNVLSCSTTMEMGVDIGNLSGIAMNNAPPSPANFLQRVGRAGRRGESAAVSLTVCRHLPHDQAVFAEPDWPFRTPMHVTAVRLDSERIVARHVNALLLTAFLSASVEPGDKVYRLTCGWFFVLEDGQVETMCDRLVSWLRTNATTDTQLGQGLRRLTQGSALAGEAVHVLLRRCEDDLLSSARRFDLQRDALDAQLAALPASEMEESPAALAIVSQRSRLDGEYLLGYLAGDQVLPGYGFPTGVVPLVTLTVQELKALKRASEWKGEETPSERSERIDARTRLMGFPSRQVPVAIREYAPGSNVILEGRTYVANGITLNWHFPPDAGESTVRELQALKTAWRCRDCGAVGATQSAVRPERCDQCPSDALIYHPFLEPAGMAVDLFHDAKMEAGPATYVPVEQPWVSSGTGELESVGTPALVRLRYSPSGTIIHQNSGIHGRGYAICLRCGRAAPESEPPNTPSSLPPALQGHFRLRGGTGSTFAAKSGEACEGNHESGWAYRRWHRLGGVERTDVLELRIHDPRTGRMLADRIAVTTLAVALRKVASRRIGVDERELGYEVVTRREFGSAGLAVMLYDTASGGAGFAAQLPALIPELFAAAVTASQCAKSCDSACHACLLSNDTQHDMAWIDRVSIAGLLTEDFLQALRLPKAAMVFGSATGQVWGSPYAAVLREARRLAPAQNSLVRLHVDGDAKIWSPASWAGRKLVRSLSTLDHVSVELVVPPGTVRELDWQQRRQIAGLIEFDGIRIVEANELTNTDSWRKWVELSDGDVCVGFATNTDSTDFDHSWVAGAPDGRHVFGPTELTPCSDPISIVASPAPGVVDVDLAAAAPGPSDSFGARIWDAILQAADLDETALRRAGAAVSISYCDRYLLSPSAALGLFEVLNELKRSEVLGAATSVRVDTVSPRDRGGHPPRQLWHSFDGPREHLRFLTAVLSQLGAGKLDVDVVEHEARTSRPHHRALTINWPNGREWEVRFDLGFGFISVQGGPHFPGWESVENQVCSVTDKVWSFGPPRNAPILAYLKRTQ